MTVTTTGLVSSIILGIGMIVFFALSVQYMYKYKELKKEHEELQKRHKNIKNQRVSDMINGASKGLAAGFAGRLLDMTLKSIDGVDNWDVYDEECGEEDKE
jgi:hypothetical protein